MKPLPPRLQQTLDSIAGREGDDIRFVLGHLSASTASSYVSQLKRRGLAYTYRASTTTEVWLHPKGRALVTPRL